MNWRQLNEACPLAFLEWVQKTTDASIESVHSVEGLYIRVANENGLGHIYLNSPTIEVFILPEYFDALGIHVDTYRVDEAARVLREFAGLETKHGYSVMVKSPTVWEGETFPTRREALEAGVIKAFEIREEQIKQKEK